MINIKTMNNYKYYSIDEVAKMLKVAYLTVYRWVRANQLIAYKAGKQYRISNCELDKFIKKNKKHD